MTITPQWKDELRARLTLSSVIMRTDKLLKAGREWKACCPFHDEKSPSFTVNDQKGFYHCFGCGAHGDVISWMVEQRGLSFIDAIKELAAEAGMEVPAPDPVAAKRAEQRASLIDVTTAAQDWFADNLKSSDGREALDYLERRGLKPETLREFGFGYAPDSKQALNRALARFDDEMLVETGMRIRTDDGTMYDRFRDRIMLPIQDARGRVIAFGGRILDSRDGVAKYLNSPDTPLFDKGRTLYNLHRAAPASRQTGRIVVVEGYMDVVALAQAGIEDAVAPMGTALTETQLEMLWRMSDTPILCFDGDEAGQRAAVRAVERALPLLRAPNSLNILTLPPGVDPDDLVRKHGSAQFEALVEKSIPLVRFVWETESRATPLETPEQRAYLRTRLLEQANAIKDAELSKLYKSALMDLFFQNIFTGPQGKKRKASRGVLSKDSLAALSYFVEHGSRELLLTATLAAIARHPQLYESYTDLLLEYTPQNRSLEKAILVFCRAAEAINEGSEIPVEIEELAEWNGPIKFPFLRDGAPLDYVRRCLDEAFIVLVKKPKAKANWEKAQEDYNEYPTETNEQRLMERIRDLTYVRERERGIARVVMG